MDTCDISTILTCDTRFTKNGSKLHNTSLILNEIFSDTQICKELSESIPFLKNAVKLLNLLLYANKLNDSFVSTTFDIELVKKVMHEGTEVLHYVDIDDIELKSALGSDYIDFKYVDISTDTISKKSEFLTNLFSSSSSNLVSSKLSSSNDLIDSFEDAEFWAQSVRLDFPYLPQPDSSNIIGQADVNFNQYYVYGESNLPWNQSQITALTDVNKFTDFDILRLFPKIRLYTRSPYMYQEYKGLEYDEDLGIILKIKGFSKKKIKQNIIEYPHITNLDRWVKHKGKTITIPFWKHIEIDGKIVSTVSIWDELEDTKKLPKTESFMNEYVVRKYLLERAAGIEHKFPLRGDLSPFLTLYAPPEYYVNLNYDPIVIGRTCVVSRQKFKYTRNPVLPLVGLRQND